MNITQHLNPTSMSSEASYRNPEGRLKGKVAFITGAARGIGRAQAVRFAEEGADVIAVDLCGPLDTALTPAATRADLQETATRVSRLGQRVRTYIVDVREFDGLREAADSGAAELGGIDVVCATAGIFSAGLALELSDAQWNTMLDVNLTGVWNTTSAVTAHLIERGGGSIVIASSVAGLKGLRGGAHYAAAKHGVVGLMRALAKELSPHGIRVNTVHPTHVNTLMTQNEHVRSMSVSTLPDPTQEQVAAPARPMNMLDAPWVEPEDVANASLFLASEEARYITSVALPVDAGSSSR